MELLTGATRIKCPLRSYVGKRKGKEEKEGETKNEKEKPNIVTSSMLEGDGKRRETITYLHEDTVISCINLFSKLTITLQEPFVFLAFCGYVFSTKD